MIGGRLNLRASVAVMSGTMDRITTWGTQGMGVRDRDAAGSDPAVDFGRLADARLDPAYRLATFIFGGDRSEAEDAVNDAALRAWEHFGDLRDLSSFEAWFTRIVVNTCRDRLSERRIRPITFADPMAGATPDHAEALARTDALERAMLTLSPKHRLVVALRYVGDYSLGEIAARTGERPGTVKSRLHYALRALRAILDAEARERIP
jgi:RNA polymerase sigma-70 factor (ECF subfamily)